MARRDDRNKTAYTISTTHFRTNEKYKTLLKLKLKKQGHIGLEDAKLLLFLPLSEPSI